MKTARFILLPLALVAGACSSSKKTSRSEYGPTYRERMSEFTRSMKQKDFWSSDKTKRSQFEKELATSTTEKKFKTGDFHAKDAKLDKKFHGTDDTFKTKGFAMADKTNKTAGKSFHDADAKNRMASEQFRTKDSRMAAEKNRNGEKMFASGGKEFSTRENREGTKAIEKNKKPVILDPEKPSYTEEDVKRLLNKTP